MLSREILAPVDRGIETERKLSVGSGFIVVGIDPNRNGENAVNPLIRTHIELTSNLATEKLAGQTSIPLERRKKGETRDHNRLGALSEITDDRGLTYLREHLHQVPESFYGNKGFLKGDPVDLTILIYDGILSIKFNPFAHDVAPKGWTSWEDFRKIENKRPLADQLVSAASNEGLIYRVVRSWESVPESRTLFIPSGFSIEAFEKEREKKQDIINAQDF